MNEADAAHEAQPATGNSTFDILEPIQHHRT